MSIEDVRQLPPGHKVWGPVVTVPKDATREEIKSYLEENPQLKSTFSKREDILAQAKMIISADRNVDYGEPERNFEDIATLWSVYKGVEFEAHDVAVMEILLKVARIKQSPSKDDHWVDIAGYAACGGEVAGNGV